MPPYKPIIQGGTLAIWYIWYIRYFSIWQFVYSSPYHHRHKGPPLTNFVLRTWRVLRCPPLLACPPLPRCPPSHDLTGPGMSPGACREVTGYVFLRVILIPISASDNVVFVTSVVPQVYSTRNRHMTYRHHATPSLCAFCHPKQSHQLHKSRL